jgi:monoamine oxidase
MLDVAIIGGGLSGLFLMRSLHQSRDVALYEARARFGGRIYSERCVNSDMDVDLGPTWYWPQTQPLFTQLVVELRLANFPQHDDGEVLTLNDPDRKPEVVQTHGLHNGARRLEGGMARLIEALQEDWPQGKMFYEHVLTRVSDHVDHIALTFRAGDREVEVEARQVVLALPPRLVAENVLFAPPLGDELRDAMQGTPTWMATRAKAIVGYEQAYWQLKGKSGSAFATHEQAVLAETFDACDGAGRKAALGGFLALTPELRRSFAVGLPMLIQNQLDQIFGAAPQHGEQHYLDWAAEPFTCSKRDLEDPLLETLSGGNPLLRRAAWGGKLFWGGSETAARGWGYMEGALEAAQRIAQQMVAVIKPAAADAGEVNAAALAQFSSWVMTQCDVAFDDYHRRLNKNLVAQQREQLTQRAMLESAEEIYRRALNVLDGMTFDMTHVAVERGRSALTPEVQKPFGDFLRRFFDDVVAFNRTSCALSNFPDEHHLSKDYTRTILRDIAAAWQEFSLAVNQILLAKATSDRPAFASDRLKTG